MTVALALAVLVAIGAFAGAGLALADKYFGVEEDPRLDELEAALPGANCGGCGYPGCRAYAKALLKGEEITLCAPGGNATVQAVARILGTEAVSVVEKVAVVKCAGTAAQTGQRARYEGISDCAAAALVSGGASECPDGCLGLGSCVAVCNYGAIEIRDGVAVIDPNLCIGDGLCVEACPRGIIEMVPKDRTVHVLCSNKQPGKKVRSICKVGCIGCKLCSKVDPAFVVADNLAQIQGDPGEGAGEAALVCPTGSIFDASVFSREEFLFDPRARERLAEMQSEYKAAKKAARAAKKPSAAKPKGSEAGADKKADKGSEAGAEKKADKGSEAGADKKADKGSEAGADKKADKGSEAGADKKTDKAEASEEKA